MKYRHNPSSTRVRYKKWVAFCKLTGLYLDEVVELRYVCGNRYVEVYLDGMSINSAYTWDTQDFRRVKNVI